jgi:hypothetical protein
VTEILEKYSCWTSYEVCIVLTRWKPKLNNLEQIPKYLMVFISETRRMACLHLSVVRMLFIVVKNFLLPRYWFQTHLIFTLDRLAENVFIFIRSPNLATALRICYLKCGEICFNSSVSLPKSTLFLHYAEYSVLVYCTLINTHRIFRIAATSIFLLCFEEILVLGGIRIRNFIRILAAHTHQVHLFIPSDWRDRCHFHLLFRTPLSRIIIFL